MAFQIFLKIFQKSIAKFLVLCYYNIRSERTLFAAMAQVVERILGKDEVGSSSLPSSSKKDGFLTVFFLLLFFSL